jgi:hypothetical protein
MTGYAAMSFSVSQQCLTAVTTSWVMEQRWWSGLFEPPRRRVEACQPRGRGILHDRTLRGDLAAYTSELLPIRLPCSMSWRSLMRAFVASQAKCIEKKALRIAILIIQAAWQAGSVSGMEVRWTSHHAFLGHDFCLRLLELLERPEENRGRMVQGSSIQASYRRSTRSFSWNVGSGKQILSLGESNNWSTTTLTVCSVIS